MGDFGPVCTVTFCDTAAKLTWQQFISLDTEKTLNMVQFKFLNYVLAK